MVPSALWPIGMPVRSSAAPSRLLSHQLPLRSQTQVSSARVPGLEGLASLLGNRRFTKLVSGYQRPHEVGNRPSLVHTISREVTSTTLATWNASATNATKKSARKKEFQKVADQISSVTFNPYDTSRQDKLRGLLKVLLSNTDFAKYKGAIDAVLADLDAGDEASRVASEQQIRTFIEENLVDLFPEKAGDFSEPALLTLRQTMLRKKLQADNASVSDLTLVHARGLANRGVHDGGSQFGTPGICQEAAEALGMVHSVEPRANGSSITWNHYYCTSSKGFKDPSWKQFFKASDTKGLPAIFDGSADEFRALGLPTEAAENYLLFIGKSKRRKEKAR